MRVPKGATTGKVTVKVKGKKVVESLEDFVVTDCSKCGVVEKFIMTNEYHIAIKPVDRNNVYYENMATKRGIRFTVDKKIRVKAIGGLFRKAGSYPLALTIADHLLSPTSLYATIIAVNNTESFTFIDVAAADIQLIPGVEYMLAYCGENHDSVYDLSPPSPSPDFLQPFDFGDVTLTWLYFNYLNDCSQPSVTAGWRNGALFMRGIVDFKYEIIE